MSEAASHAESLSRRASLPTHRQAAVRGAHGDVQHKGWVSPRQVATTVCGRAWAPGEWAEVRHGQPAPIKRCQRCYPVGA